MTKFSMCGRYYSGSLQIVSSTFVYDITTLELNECGITVIQTNGAFKGAMHVVNLHLQENGLTTLQAFSFVDMVNLKYLNLNLNDLSVIDYSAFIGLTCLQKLYIGERSYSINNIHNKLTDFPNLQDSWNTLVTLSYSENLLTSLAWDQFANFTLLENLFLKGNKFLSIPIHSWVRKNNTIKKLSISFDDNAVVSPHFFANFTHLEEITLSSMNWMPDISACRDTLTKLTLFQYTGTDNIVKSNFVGADLNKDVILESLIIDGGPDYVRLDYVSDNFLSFLSHLKYLQISNTYMTNFPNLTLLQGSLEEISFSRNSFDDNSIVPSKFQNLSRLHKIYMYYCGITNFTWHVLNPESVPALTYFSLTYSLTTIYDFRETLVPPLLFDNFYLMTSPFRCDPDMCWIKDFDDQGVYPSNANTSLQEPIFSAGQRPCTYKRRFSSTSWANILGECICNGR